MDAYLSLAGTSSTTAKASGTMALHLVTVQMFSLSIVESTSPANGEASSVQANFMYLEPTTGKP